MDCRALTLVCLMLLLACFVTYSECRSKKVVIHVPFKVKKIRHTHTVYKTVHHHHQVAEPEEHEHEHFHHMHVHDEPHGHHSQPAPGLAIPDFLPDVPDLLVPHDAPLISNVHGIPIYKKH